MSLVIINILFYCILIIMNLNYNLLMKKKNTGYFNFLIKLNLKNFN